MSGIRRLFCILSRYYFIVISGTLFITPIHADYLTMRYGSIQLSAYERDWKFGEDVVRISRALMPTIKVSLGISSDTPVHIVIADTESAFQRMTGNQIPEWGVAAADAYKGVIYFKSPRFNRLAVGLKILVAHELCHVIMGHAVGKHSVPRWFDEGFALYISGELGLEDNIVLGRSLIGNQIIPLDAIDDVLAFQQQKAVLAYRESLAAIQYLIERHGEAVLARFVMALSEGKRMNQAVYSVTGVSMATFENQWIHYLRQKYLWYAVLDTRFILSFLFVVLFLWAWTKKNIRSRRQQAVWKHEEDYENIID